MSWSSHCCPALKAWLTSSTHKIKPEFLTLASAAFPVWHRLAFPALCSRSLHPSHDRFFFISCTSCSTLLVCFLPLRFHISVYGVSVLIGLVGYKRKQAQSLALGAFSLSNQWIIQTFMANCEKGCEGKKRGTECPHQDFGLVSLEKLSLMSEISVERNRCGN